MTLAECIDAYVAFKRSLGMRFRSEAELLSTFFTHDRSSRPRRRDA